MTLNKKTYDLLRKNKIFEGISVESSGIDLNQESVKKFKEGDIIFQRNDQVDFMYLIVEGKVKIKFSEKNILLNKSDYDFFGEKEITDKTNRISSAVADTDCTIYCIMPGLVDNLLTRNRKISDNILLQNLKNDPGGIFNRTISEPDTQNELQSEIEPVQNPSDETALQTEGENIVQDVSEEIVPIFPSSKITSDVLMEEVILDDNEGRDLFELQKTSEEKATNPINKTFAEEIVIAPDLETNNSDLTNYEHEKKYIEFVRYNFDSLHQAIENHPDADSANKKNTIIELASLSKNIISSVNSLFSQKYFMSDEILAVHHILNNTLPVIKESLSRSDIKILKRIKTNCSVKINMTDFSVVCHQIVKNAAESMPLGGRIFISAEDVDDKIELKIKDQGNGIPEFLFENIFAEFFTHGKNNSVGLGLFLAKKIITDFGGAIYSESELGESTTIIIKLPIA